LPATSSRCIGIGAVTIATTGIIGTGVATITTIGITDIGGAIGTTTIIIIIAGITIITDITIITGAGGDCAERGRVTAGFQHCGGAALAWPVRIS
jgi:hypothetical protein